MPRSTGYSPGETVRVTLIGAVVAAADPLVVTAASGEQVTVPAGDDVTVELMNPANWPPQGGDVWLDGNGQPWFANWVVVTGATEPSIRMQKFNDRTTITADRFKTDARPVRLAFRATLPTP